MVTTGREYYWHLVSSSSYAVVILQCTGQYLITKNKLASNVTVLSLRSPALPTCVLKPRPQARSLYSVRWNQSLNFHESTHSSRANEGGRQQQCIYTHTSSLEICVWAEGADDSSMCDSVVCACMQWCVCVCVCAHASVVHTCSGGRTCDVSLNVVYCVCVYYVCVHAS
jgi:hypothetical protein